MKPQRFCLFCGGPGLTRTHIWPDWLNRLLRPPNARLEELEHPRDETVRKLKLKQGSVFSQKPYLCCAKCNGGWMKRFEDEMLKFSRPLFTSLEQTTRLSETQTRVLAVWASLITILAEFIDHKGSVCISAEDRRFLMERLRPPDTWTILAISINSATWYAKYRHFAKHIAQFTSIAEYHAAVAGGKTQNNCQISTFGMGRLLVQIFSCPNDQSWLIQDYESFASASGVTQIWPLRKRLWPLTPRLTSFPTSNVFDDSQAEDFSNAFNRRLEFLTQPPYFGGRLQ